MKADDTIRAKCLHSRGIFVEFQKEKIEQSIPDRFEQRGRMYPEWLAVKTRNHTLSYEALDRDVREITENLKGSFKGNSLYVRPGRKRTNNHSGGAM